MPVSISAREWEISHHPSAFKMTIVEVSSICIGVSHLRPSGTKQASSETVLFIYYIIILFSAEGSGGVENSQCVVNGWTR